MKKEESFILTFTGIKFYPFNPNKADVNLEDIAQSLFRQCRFNGHTETHYSVAHHSILIAQAIESEGYGKRIALLGLLHDAGEAYFSDIPSPIKKFLPEISEIEDNILNAIFDGLSIERPTDEEWAIVMEFDKAILPAEGKYLTNNPELWNRGVESDKTRLFSKEDFEYTNRSEVKNDFMKYFNDLRSC